jgi:hypothetical protein
VRNHKREHQKVQKRDEKERPNDLRQFFRRDVAKIADLEELEERNPQQN